MWQTKRFLLTAILIAVVLSGSVLGISCSSSGDESEEPPDTPQDADPPEGMLVSPGLSEDLLARVAEILGIDQEQVANAFEQAQSELATMPEDRQPSSAPPGDGPQEGTSPPDMPSEGIPSEDMPPEGMPSEDTFPGDMSPGFGLPDELLARAAEILGIDQQELADAVEQAQDEMASETVPPSSNQ